MRPARIVLAFSILVASAAQADAPESDTQVHAAVSLGIGYSQDIAGLGLELRAGHFGAAIGAGVPLVVGIVENGSPGSAMGSLRYFSGDYFFAVNGGVLLSSPRLFGDENIRAWALSITAVRRFQVKHWFWQLGVGPAVIVVNDSSSRTWIPGLDVQLAGGYEF